MNHAGKFVIWVENLQSIGCGYFVVEDRPQTIPPNIAYIGGETSIEKATRYGTKRECNEIIKVMQKTIHRGRLVILKLA